MPVWEQTMRAVTPYVPGEQPKRSGMIKLNTNENPYPPAPGVAAALAAFDTDRLRLYPDPAMDTLVSVLAKRYGVRKGQVFVGVGSDDVLSTAFLTCFHSEKPILFPDVTYSFYDVWAQVYGIPYKQIPVDEGLSIVPERYFQENGGIVFPNPNAPTGALLPPDAVEQIVSHNPDVIVIVDEAYIDFGGVSAVPLIEKYDNLLVVQTFSKSRSMAGLRIGYALGSERLISHLYAVRNSINSYTMNAFALSLGVCAVEDEAYFQNTCATIIATRERVKRELAALGFSFPDSQANFLFVRHEKVPARELFAALREAGILVRYFDKPRIDEYLRITIGTGEEMNRLTAFLREYLKQSSR